MKSTRIPTPTSRVRAGLGTADITPPVGIYHRFWGAASHDQSTGIHRPLRASVLVLEPAPETDSEASERQVLIALDHCLFRPPEMREFREKTCAKLQMASSRYQQHAVADPQRSIVAMQVSPGVRLDEKCVVQVHVARSDIRLDCQCSHEKIAIRIGGKHGLNTMGCRRCLAHERPKRTAGLDEIPLNVVPRSWTGWIDTPKGEYSTRCNR